MIRMHHPPSWLGTVRAFMRAGSCSEALTTSVNAANHHPMGPAERAAMSLAGGVMQQGYQCGLLWGAALAAGGEALSRFGATPRAQASAVHASRACVVGFREQNPHTDCLELTDTDWKKPGDMRAFMLKLGPLRCFNRAGRYGASAYHAIQTTIGETLEEPGTQHRSCASRVIELLGGSPDYQTLAAGFAGGLGLSGGSCGALAAVVWQAGLDRPEGKAQREEYKNPDLYDLVDRFATFTGGEMECRNIIGRTFASEDDHAEYVSAGGCGDLLAMLAEIAPRSKTVAMAIDRDGPSNRP